jgi:polysaccharide export outer membrane protein
MVDEHRGSMRFAARFVGLAVVGLGLAGCGAMPAQGPSTSEVINASVNVTPDTGGARYLLTDVNERTVLLLEKRGAPTMAGRFGDYRGASPTQTIGVGDQVQVVVWEAAAGGLFSTPALSGATTGSHSAVIPPQQVARDGSITVPYAGRLRVLGLTPPQVEQAVVSNLAGKAIEPQALVTVVNNISSTVTVTGEVIQGARVPLSPRGDRILDVIATAGGVKAPVNETFISLGRGGVTVRVPMQSLLVRPQENIFLRPSDILTLVREPQTFTAFGATGRNALVPFDALGVTLEEAVAKSGGLVDVQSDPQGVFVLRPEPASLALELNPAYPLEPGQRIVNVVYRANMRDPSTFFWARRFQIHNKDIVYVSTAPLTEVQKAFNVLSSIYQPVLAAAAICSGRC